MMSASSTTWDASTLPTLNAALNGLATLLLIVGYVLIKQKKYKAHGIVMSSAFFTSAVFLVFYLLHKYYYPDIRLRERFPDLPSWMAYVYWFVILIPHLILAVAMLPMIFLGFLHAFNRQWDKHRAINRYTIWIWLYVSATGVLIYWLLYHYFPAVTSV
jgi:putative membrane protein